MGDATRSARVGGVCQALEADKQTHCTAGAAYGDRLCRRHKGERGRSVAAYKKMAEDAERLEQQGAITSNLKLKVVRHTIADLDRAIKMTTSYTTALRSEMEERIDHSERFFSNGMSCLVAYMQ